MGSGFRVQGLPAQVFGETGAGLGLRSCGFRVSSEGLKSLNRVFWGHYTAAARRHRKE